MAANTDPIWSKAPNNQSVAGVVIGPSANTAQDGTGANIYVVWQADTANGGFLEYVNFYPVGSPAATVARIYLYKGSSGTFTAGTSNTAANTFCIGDLALISVTLSQTVAGPRIAFAANIGVDAGDRILVSFGTSTGAAGTGYVVVGIGGKY